MRVWSLFVFKGNHSKYHSNPSLGPNYCCWRSWSWMALWRPTRPSRTNTRKRYPFHHREPECKSWKSRHSWSNRQVCLWNTKLSKQRLTEFCQENTVVIACTFFQQHRRWHCTWTSPDGQYWNQIDYILCSWRWRNSIKSTAKRQELTVAQVMNSLLQNSDLN